MTSKKVNRSYKLELFGYSLAILIGIVWGLASINNPPKLQERRSPSVISS